MRISDKLAEILLKRSSKVSKKQISDLHSQSQKTNKPLQDLIIQNGLMSEAELTRLYADELNVPFVELPAGNIKYHVLKRLPEHVANRYKAVVFDIDNGDNSILVAMEDPNDLDALSFLQKQLGDNLKLHVTTSSLLKEALDKYKTQDSSDLLNVMTRQVVSFEPKIIDTDSLAEGSDAAESISHIIEQAVNIGASDIHIEPRMDHVVIRFRVDGLLREVHKLPIESLDLLVDYIKTTARLKQDEHHAPQYGQWNITIGDQRFGVRVTILPTVDGEKVVLHVLHESVEAPSFRDLGLWGTSLHDLKKAIVQPHGTVFIAGPIGSGKSTTLFSLLSALNTPNVNIATLEDPVEYRIAGANQVQINQANGVTLASGLRAILNQDPNIIMMSELRDSESSKLAIQASLTGHLVFSTLHTSSAATGFRRLLDLDIEPFIVANNVRAIVGQRLARRLCPDCREIIVPDATSLKQIEKTLNLTKNGELRHLHELESLALDEGVGLLSHGKTASAGNQLSTSARSITRLWKARDGGCEHCHHSGYHGRIGIFEVLIPNESVQKTIIHNDSDKEIDKAAQATGMISMQLDGIIKVLRGLTTLAEVLRVTSHGS
jgi:type IV pilus assembly protein PilB